MNCLSWNCRGAGNPRTVRELRDLVARFKPEIVFLMEVMSNLETMERIKRKIHYERLFFVQGTGRGGGVQGRTYVGAMVGYSPGYF